MLELFGPDQFAREVRDGVGHRGVGPVLLEYFGLVSEFNFGLVFQDFSKVIR